MSLSTTVEWRSAKHLSGTRRTSQTSCIINFSASAKPLPEILGNQEARSSWDGGGKLCNLHALREDGGGSDWTLCRTYPVFVLVVRALYNAGSSPPPSQPTDRHWVIIIRLNLAPTSSDKLLPMQFVTKFSVIT